MYARLAFTISNKKAMMEHFNLNLSNPDNNRILRSKRNQYSIAVIDQKTQQVLYQREDFGGYHTGGIFTEDENIVIYLTVDPRWYVPPIIKIWNLKENSVADIITSHDIQDASLKIAYNAPLQRLVLGSLDGSHSIYNLYSRAIIHHHYAPEPHNNNQIVCLAVSGCGEIVAVLQEDMLVLYDCTTGKKQFSSPLMNIYSDCQFAKNDLLIQVTHPQHAPINIAYKTD